MGKPHPQLWDLDPKVGRAFRWVLDSGPADTDAEGARCRFGLRFAPNPRLLGIRREPCLGVIGVGARVRVRATNPSTDIPRTLAPWGQEHVLWGLQRGEMIRNKSKAEQPWPCFSIKQNV